MDSYQCRYKYDTGDVLPREKDNVKEKSNQSNHYIFRRPKTQNVVTRLFNREVWGTVRPVGEKHEQSSILESVNPNFTVTEVIQPGGCIVRKFTPDGRKLIAISQDQRYIEVYRFGGSQAAKGLFRKMGAHWLDILQKKEDTPGTDMDRLSGSFSELWKHSAGNGSSKSKSLKPEPSPAPTQKFVSGSGNELPDHIGSDHGDTLANEIRRYIFGAFFQLKFRIPVAIPPKQLNAECFHFTDDSKYMIVSSPRVPLEDYSIHFVDIEHGRVTRKMTNSEDEKKFAGFSFYKNKVALLSVKNQEIVTFLCRGGKWSCRRRLGKFPFLSLSEELLYFFELFWNDDTGNMPPPEDDAFMCGLKLRALIHLYKKYPDEEEMSSGEILSKKEELSRYYGQMMKSKLRRMELLDEDHLLMNLTETEGDAPLTSNPGLFLLYNIRRKNVVAVYDEKGSMEELEHLFKTFPGHFQNHNLYMNTYSTAKYMQNATRGILSQLPISPQSFYSSPYLNRNLFAYDENRIPEIEGPVHCDDNSPIRFYARDTLECKFQFHMGNCSISSPPSSGNEQDIHFTFHPSEPFAVSVQRAVDGETITNFHFRLDTSSVLPLDEDSEE